MSVIRSKAGQIFELEIAPSDVTNGATDTMSLLRTAQASPTRKRSGKVSTLRAKFENMSAGQSSSIRSNSILGGCAKTTNTDPELKKLVHDATKEVLNAHDESISSDGDQSINSFMRTLSGSGSSSFSVSKAFHAVKRKMNHQKGADGSVNTPPPLLEVQKNNSRKVSLGGNLQMDFNFTMPIDRVHVQNSHQPLSPTPQDAFTPKSKKEAYAKAEKMLAKLDEQQKLKAARAKQITLEVTKQARKKSNVAKKPSKVKVVKVTQVAEDTSTIDNSQASLNADSNRGGTKNQKQRLLARLEKMGLKPLKVSTGASRVSEPPSMQSSVYTSNTGVDPDGQTAASLAPQDPSGFVVSCNPDDGTARSGSSSRSNEENLDPTSPRSVRTPKSTNRSSSKTMNFDESDLRRDRSSTFGSQSSYRSMSEPQISTRPSDDVNSQADYPNQNHFDFDDEDNSPQNQFDTGSEEDHDDYSIASISLNPHGDDVAADIAQQILGGFKPSMASYRLPETRRQRVETIRSSDISVQVVSDGGGENFEAVHVDDPNPHDDEDFEVDKSSGKQPYVFEDSLNESFVSNYRLSTYANEGYEMDRAMMYPEDDDDERSSGLSYDRYAVDGKESLNDVMTLAEERLSAPDHPSENPSYADISFGMEDILNMAASRLGGSAGARGPSSFSFDSMMEFATGRLSTTPKASAESTASVNASEKGKTHQTNDSALRTLNSLNDHDDNAASSSVREPKAFRTGNPSTPGSQLSIHATYPTWQKSVIDQSERASHSADWSVEPDDEVFIDIDTDEPHTSVSTRQENSSYPTSHTSINEPSPTRRGVSQTKPLCPSPESPRPAHPVKTPESLLAASRRVVRPKLPARSQLKETIDAPPAEAFNHPIPIQMSPGKSLFDDLSHSMAPSSMSDSISALTREERRGVDAKEKAHHLQTKGDGDYKSTTYRQNDPLHNKSDAPLPAAEAYQEILNATPKIETEKQPSAFVPHSVHAGAFCSLLSGIEAPTGVDQANPKMYGHSKVEDDGKSPYSVDHFPGLASVELATPPSSPTNALAAVKQGVLKKEHGPNGSESLLNDDDDYWDTLSSIATESILRSQKNFEEVSRAMGAEMYPLSPVYETSLEVESGCVCPWNEHLRLPRDHPDYTGPPQQEAVNDILLNASSIESIDENIPVEIAYLPDITGMMHLAKEPQPSLPGSENISASLGNLRSILTASSSSSSSESSLIYSDGRFLDDYGNSAESYTGSNNGDAAGSDLQEAIKRGEVQAFVDSPTLSDNDRGFVEQEHSDSNYRHLADSLSGPPPLPTLMDTEIQPSTVKRTDNSQLEKKAKVYSADYRAEQSAQALLSEFEAALGPHNEVEMRGANLIMFPVDGRDTTKPQADIEQSLKALHHLLSEEKAEESYDSFDDEYNDNPQTALLVTQSTSNDRQNRENEKALRNTYHGMMPDDGSGNYRSEYQDYEDDEAIRANANSQPPSDVKSVESDIVLDEDYHDDDDNENLLLLAYSKSEDRMERNHPFETSTKSIIRSMAPPSSGSLQQRNEQYVHTTPAQFDAFDSQDDYEVSDIHRGMVSVHHTENDNLDLQGEREPKASHLNAMSQLLSEDKTEESDDFLSEDCDDNSENTNDLLLALSRSNDRLDRNYPYEATSPPSTIGVMDFAQSGGIDMYLEAIAGTTTVDNISPDDSIAALGGSPKRRKMKEGVGIADFDSNTPVTYTNRDVRNPETDSSAERPFSPTKQRVSTEPSLSAERPLSPTKQRLPSPEVNLSPLELLMEEAEIILSKGLHNRPAPRVTPSSVTPPMDRSDKAVTAENVTAERPLETSNEMPGKSVENPSSSQAISPTKKRFGALMIPTVSSMLCSSTAMEYLSIDALSPPVSPAYDTEEHRGRANKDLAGSNDPAGDISRIPSPEKARFPSPERAAKRLSPVKGRPPSPEKAREEVSRKASHEKARISTLEKKAAHGLSPAKERPPSPEKAPRIHSPKKDRQSSPEKAHRNRFEENERQPSPGITPISPARLQRISPRRRPPTPERQFTPPHVSRLKSPANKRTTDNRKSSVQHKEDVAVSLRSRRNLGVETNELEPAYSFDKDKQGRKKLGRSPRLESVLARVQLRRQEKFSRPKEAKDLPTMEETLEEYDTVLDQLVRQNNMLKRGGTASETSLGSDSDAIKERIIDLRLKSRKAMTSIPRVAGEENAGPSPETKLSGRQRQRSPVKAHDSHAIPGSTRASRSISPVSSVAKLESGLRYRAETDRAFPSTPITIARPPTPERAHFSRSPVRSRSVPTSREVSQGRHEPYSRTTSRLLNESAVKARRVASYSEQAKAVFSPVQEREDRRHPPEVSPQNVDATIENKYQRLAENVFTPISAEPKAEERQQHSRPSFIDKRQTRISSPPRRLESRSATTPKSTRSYKWDDILKTKSAPLTALSGGVPVSKTPHMDRLMRERGYTRPADDSSMHHSSSKTPPSDARNPSPAQRESPWRDSRRRSGGGTTPVIRKEERQEYSPLRRESALTGMDPTFQQQPISSPERRRLLGSYISDQTQQLKRDLDLARLSSHKIRKSNVMLSSELEAFKHKLSQHARSKAGERAIIGACQYELGGFQQRLQEVTRGGRGSMLGARNDSFMSDMTLETAWEDFSEIRNAMLTNLKVMHDAQERLMRERFRIQEHDDQDAARLMEIQNLMATIQRQEKYDSNLVRIALEEAEQLG